MAVRELTVGPRWGLTSLHLLGRARVIGYAGVSSPARN